MPKITLITRKNPKTGEIERPWRDAEGCYVLADPRQGAGHHHRAKSVSTADYDEAVRRVRDGFSIRMKAKGTPPSLIRAASLTFEEVELEGPYEALMHEPPFSRNLMRADLAKALLAQAAAIAYWSNVEVAAAFIGYPADEASEPYMDDDGERIELARFDATRVFDHAYDYAFQVGRPEVFGPDTWHELARLLDSGTAGAAGIESPLTDDQSALRRTGDTAFARWKLDNEPGLTLSTRDLALLGCMDDNAVRNSLGQDKISARGGVPNEVAREWLKERRGFVPTL